MVVLLQVEKKMISISKKKFNLIVKLGLVILVIYIIGFCFFQVANFYKVSFEKDKLSEELKAKKTETIRIKNSILGVKNKTKAINKKYITKEQLDTKVKDIFERMSVLDYNLRFLNSKQVCVDNYILVTQLTSRSENGIKAGEGILSYIGEIKKSDKNSTIYFVNYINKEKGIK